MISKYGIFCKVIEMGSFTRVAEELGYSQSAVSQTIKAIEQEAGMTLIERKKDGIRLTADGPQYLPYMQAIYAAEQALAQKQGEMQGLYNSTIRIGTFTSVSRTLLPPLMKEFRTKYPTVNFILRQGEYTSIANWVQEGSVDFGFVHAGAVDGLATEFLYADEMMAVLPPGHALAKKRLVKLDELAEESYILLDEGKYSVAMHAFLQAGISPKVAYEVYDDYTILAMVRQGLGVSMMYEKVLQGFEHGLEVRKIDGAPKRSVALAYRNWDTMSYASRRFVEFIHKKY